MNQLHKGILAFMLLALTLAGCGGGGGTTTNTGNTAGSNPGGTGGTGGTTGTANAGVVTTFAGSGFPSSWDAFGTSAMFNGPSGVAVDAAGNVYVADQWNHQIRKITPAGAVSTLAGSGTIGAVDGTGRAASFNYPAGVAVDGTGNVYVADRSNHKIRKITPAGVVSTFAGSGTIGAADGTGTAASFNFPEGVAVDAAGNVYVGDSSNNKIRKITPAGVVSTLAGSGTIGAVDGTGTAATFKLPYGVAVDGAGNVYVADGGNGSIRKITPAGVVSTLAGSGSFSPSGVAVDGAGNVYVADNGNNKIRMITPAGVVSTLAGSGLWGAVDGTGAAASFGYPYGVAVNAVGTVYVADSGSNKIRMIR